LFKVCDADILFPKQSLDWRNY